MKKELLLELIGELFKNSSEQSSVEPIKVDSGDVRIVILQRGWIYVGKYFQDGDECWLEDAACIRSWGTSKGLGEIAENGPTSNTKLDPNPTVRFHRLTIVATIDCNQSKWKEKL